MKSGDEEIDALFCRASFFLPKGMFMLPATDTDEP